MLSITIRIDDEQAQEYFAYAGYKIRDMRDPLRDVRDQVIRPAIREALDSEGESIGEVWPAYSEDYGTRKETSLYADEPMLTRTRTARAVLDNPAAYHITQTKLDYFIFSDYMYYHQSGEAMGGKQRRWLDITTDDEYQIQGIFEAWLDELALANRRRGNPEYGRTFGVPNVEVLV